MEKKPLISIGMPVYNGDRFLSESLESLLNQDYQNFELIISDNASTDNTADICKQYIERDNRIKYYRNNVNIGAMANFNKVLKHATASYFMWAAHDDVWEPSFISDLIKILNSDESIGLAFCKFDNIDKKGRQIKMYPKILRLISLEKNKNKFYDVYNFILFNEEDGKANLIYGLMRTGIIKKIGGIIHFDKGNFGIDNLTLFRLLLEGKFIISNKLLFHKRIHTINNIKQKRYTISEYFFKIDQPVHNICKYFLEIHRYFLGYRQIVSMSSLSLHHKMILQMLITFREIMWPIRTSVRVLAHRKLLYYL